MVEFVDAQKRHLEYPNTFEVPNKNELNRLAVGDIVKVCADDKERFWANLREF